MAPISANISHHIISIYQSNQMQSPFLKSTYTHHDFDFIADEILNHMILVVNHEHRYRICEIEMYYKDQSDHPDPYVHANQDQLRNGYYYFHKFPNGSYKSGTYKGMDVTLGSEDHRIYFGVLLRSIENLQTHEFIEGPCRIVNKFLEHFQCSDVRDVMNRRFNNAPVLLTNELLQLKRTGEDETLPSETIYHGPRIGLSEKAPQYQKRPYRYAIKIKNIKKERKTFVST